MVSALTRQIHAGRQRLRVLAAARSLQSLTGYFDERRLLLDSMERRMLSAASQNLGKNRQRYACMTAALDAMSPLKVLARGYAIGKQEDGRLLRSVEQVQPGEKIVLALTDGDLAAEVTEIHRRTEHA